MPISSNFGRPHAHAPLLRRASQPVLYPASHGPYPDAGTGRPLTDGSGSYGGDVPSFSSSSSPPPELWSPQTGLRYRVDGLQDPDTEAAVRDVLSHADPVDMHFSQCRLHERVYAFEIKETVTRTVRIGPPGSRYFKPTCEACSAGSGAGAGDANNNNNNNNNNSYNNNGDTSVCRHVVWVMDHLARQGLVSAAGVVPHQGSVAAAPLTMGPDGHAVELGCPYDMLVRGMPLAALAARLRCRVAPPAGHVASPVADLGRIAEIRRLLAAVSGPGGRWDHLDERMLAGLDSQGEGGVCCAGCENPVRRGDLDGTLFRMLYANPAFFAYFRSQVETECACECDDFYHPHYHPYDQQEQQQQQHEYYHRQNHGCSNDYYYSVHDYRDYNYRGHGYHDYHEYHKYHDYRDHGNHAIGHRHHQHDADVAMLATPTATTTLAEGFWGGQYDLEMFDTLD